MGEELSGFKRRVGEALRGASFSYKQWKGLADYWTHDHCAMCVAQIRENPLDGDYADGYVHYTPDGGPPRAPMQGHGVVFMPAPPEPEGNATWVCPKCFAQFQEEFDWKVNPPVEPTV